MTAFLHQQQSTQSMAEELTTAKPSTTHTRKRRRTRMIASCLECRRRKVGCTKELPCAQCRRYARECLYLAPALELMTQQRGQERQPPAESLEELLGRASVQETTRQSISNPSPPSSSAESASPPGETLTTENEKYLEPAASEIIDAIHADDADESVQDLGVRIGKMRMTDRVGGLHRPNIHKEIDRVLQLQGSERRTLAEQMMPAYLSDDGTDFLGPGPTYIEPGAGFIFGNVGIHADRSVLECLPLKPSADELVHNYYENVHPIARVLHWSTFLHHYEQFWQVALTGLQPPHWQEALVLSVLFSAVASMNDRDVQTYTGLSRTAVIADIQTFLEAALVAAQFLTRPRLETLQAFTVYLTTMCLDQLSKAHTALVSMAVRQAECLGLHMEPDSAQDGHPAQLQVRRILWHQLSFLDFRACMAHGPRPAIRPDEYETRFPLNQEDSRMGGDPGEDSLEWTGMTCSKIRFECTEMQKTVWFDRVRVEKNTMSLTDCLAKIESFRRTMEAKYARALRPIGPIQRYARHMMTLSMQTLYVMILFRYLRHYGQQVPDRLRQLVLHAGVVAMESAIAMDTNVDFTKWKWYNGAYQQWHIAFMLLSDINRFPDRESAKRTWAILDYVFEPSPDWSSAVKCRTIMTTIRDRTQLYQEGRGKRKKGAAVLPAVTHAIAVPPSNAIYDDPVRELSDTALLTAYDLPSTVNGATNRFEKNEGPFTASVFPDMMRPVAPSQDTAMTDIDWNEWDKLFPLDMYPGF